jgi:hypothetical protein
VTVTNDVHAWPVVQALIAALVEEYVDSELEAPAWAGSLPGALATLDGSTECGGQTWVRISSAFPSVDFPTADGTRAQARGTWGYRPAFVLEVGTVRCVSVESDEEENEAPTPAQTLEETRVQLADMAAMRRAICKVMKEQGRAFVLGNYAPYGPQGAIAGGTWSPTFEGIPSNA